MISRDRDGAGTPDPGAEHATGGLDDAPLRRRGREPRERPPGARWADRDPVMARWDR